ncbi:hypothetical protein M513_01876 [Trichuris suis]|uniref:DUF19 domain-containing protein n=2 Tax=Trichuris suis TaxID=68888 RepID=A0A085MJG9_9BILA|nr:hypothetical protein M513_01876 [Trichuris suis]
MNSDLSMRFYAFTLFIGIISIATHCHPVDYFQNSSCLNGCATKYAQGWGKVMLLYNNSRSPVSAEPFGFKELFSEICNPAKESVACTQKCLDEMKTAEKYNGGATFSNAILDVCKSKQPDFTCLDNSTASVKSACGEHERKAIASLDSKHLWTTDDKKTLSRNLTDFCQNSKALVNCVQQVLARECNKESASFVENLMTHSIASIRNLGKDTTSPACRQFDAVTLAMTSATKSTEKYSTTIARENSTTAVATESSEQPKEETPPTGAAPKPAAIVWMTICLAIVSIRSFST